MRIPEEVIEQVRSNVEIVDIVGQYVQLRKSGKNYFGLCPFHEEKTPSFSVAPEKQIFHCFSCHRGGNVFKFIMEIEKISFPEAVLKVAELGGISLPPQLLNSSSDQTVSADSETGQLRRVYTETAQLFHHILLNTQLGESALTYLQDRGLTTETIEKFQLGFAPPQEVLATFLSEKGFSHQLLIKTGLFAENQSGVLRQRFRERVLFPIRDGQGYVVAFSGRTLSQDPKVPKYLNSPETKLFNKRKILFNFDLAKSAIRQNGFALLLEGFMDVLSAYQVGVKNGIASMGTSLTNEQVYLLERTTERLCLCYDGDDPGQNAIARALKLLQPITRLKLNVVLLPEKQDPDEYIQKNGGQAFKNLVTKGQQTKMSFWMTYLAAKHNLENENEQLAYISEVLEKIAQLLEPVERDLYLNQLAKRFALEKSSLTRQLHVLMRQQKQFKQPALSQQAKQSPDLSLHAEKKYSQIEKAERLLLYRLLQSYEVRSHLKGVTGFSFIHDQYQTIYLLAEGYFQVYDEYETARFLDFLQADDLRQIIISLEIENYAKVGSMEEIQDCVRLIMQVSPIEEKLLQVKHQLIAARKTNDQQLITKLTIEFVDLLKQKQLKKSTSL
ncbi:DNA primase [Liquorilactobacillus sicerae]|uniref:DNA primase n=1 Tax=Liquorilactobacillus sicerae TaxID=1416943 RepID=UPI002480E3E1|nr:DNA primase [Liquorilactobacillus sicerae]